MQGIVCMKSNILIVEDHELTRFGLKTAFESCDFVEEIYEAESAEVGIDIVDKKQIDLVIMDLGLPGIDGIEATQRIKQYNKDVKIVILTSHNDSQEVLNSLKAGANAYCSKEINECCGISAYSVIISIFFRISDFENHLSIFSALFNFLIH